MIDMIFDKKTYIPEKGVWVSTVAWNYNIGLDRSSETMVFKGDEEGIEDYTDFYMESHGHTYSKDTLTRAHKRIVAGIEDGTIELEEVD